MGNGENENDQNPFVSVQTINSNPQKTCSYISAEDPEFMEVCLDHGLLVSSPILLHQTRE